MGISSLQSWLKKLGDPENGRCTKALGFISKIKLRKKLGSDDKKDEDNGLQKSDNKSITFKHKPNKDLDHLVNSLEKDTEIEENETKSLKNLYLTLIQTSEKRKNDHIRKGKINLTLLGEKKENENQ